MLLPLMNAPHGNELIVHEASVVKQGMYVCMYATTYEGEISFLSYHACLIC